MAVRCDTASVPAADRAELWVEATSQLFVPLECTPTDPQTFNGRLQAGSVGPLALCGLEVMPHTVRRTPRLANNTEGNYYKLSLMLGGEALVVQDRREAVLRPGDFALYDCSRPYTLVGGDSFRMLICMLPRDVLALGPDQIERITATRIVGGDGLGWAMAPFLKRLADLAIRDEVPTDAHRVAESVIDLVESLCKSLIGGGADLGVSRSELMLRIRAYVEGNLGDPDLAPARIAAAHFVSKRYLHKLFEAEGVSVSRFVRERRLERCRADLADPKRRDHTVTSIGACWGLADSAHFSRLFREAYGCTPTEYRREHQPAGH